MTLKFALIVGSTRPKRFADTPVEWIVTGAAARDDFTLDVLDLREQNLPFLNEPAPPSYTGGRYSDPRAEASCLTLGAYDGYIATVAEYNHGPTAALKNALDSARLARHQRDADLPHRQRRWRREVVGELACGPARGLPLYRGFKGPMTHRRSSVRTRATATGSMPAW